MGTGGCWEGGKGFGYPEGQREGYERFGCEVILTTDALTEVIRVELFLQWTELGI